MKTDSPASAPSLRRTVRALGREAATFAGFSGDATFCWPRWLLLRAVGLLFVIAFSGILAEAGALVGPSGLLPLSRTLTEISEAHPNPLTAFLRAPSLFWLGTSSTMILGVGWAGLVAATLVTFNLRPRVMLGICWVCLLSFVAAWRGFSASQVDQLLLEAGLLCIPFAPAGAKPGLAPEQPPYPIVILTLRWFLLRLMLENGLVKVFGGDPHWQNLTALDTLYETSPFPTLLGYYDHQLPHAYHVGEAVFTYVAEIVAPLVAIFGGRRGRGWAFVVWTLFQAGIQATNNFGWLNTASIGFGLLLLDDQMLARFGQRWFHGSLFRLPDAATPFAAGSGRSARRTALTAALGVHAGLTVYFLAITCGLPLEGFPYALGRPLHFLFWDFRSANTYTLFAGLLPQRIGVEFEGSNDAGRTWRTYAFRYQPQRPGQIPPFIAPRYARFEATLQVEAHRAEKSGLFSLVAAQLLARNPDVLALFAQDPFGDAPPTLVRMPVYHLKFTDLDTQRKTGAYWHRSPAGYHGPLLYRDAQGRILAAASEADEVRVLAEFGHPAAQMQMGARLAYGEGVPKDLAKAAPWFRAAADQGHAEAQFFYALCLANGDGIARDPVAAAAYYERAARQGNTMAQTNLAVILAKGDGVAKNEDEALAWFMVAAKAGGPEVQRIVTNLGARLGLLRTDAARRRAAAFAAGIEAHPPAP